MTGYQTIRLVDWAGMLKSRKRMQKVVYLLQCAGCPLDSEFELHHYGPYSQDVARITDQMVLKEFLKESETGSQQGSQYNYELTEIAKSKLQSFEATEDGKKQLEAIAPFEERAKRLLAEGLRELEVASTIAYYREAGDAWETAISNACMYKHIDQTTQQDFVKKVSGIAREFCS